MLSIKAGTFLLQNNNNNNGAVSPAGPPELEVDDAAVAELVLEAGHGHGAERRTPKW